MNTCLKLTMDKLFQKRDITGDIKFIVGSEEIRPVTSVSLSKSETKITFCQPVSIPRMAWWYIFIESKKFKSKSGKK